jgi:hypothetical protein
MYQFPMSLLEQIYVSVATIGEPIGQSSGGGSGRFFSDVGEVDRGLYLPLLRHICFRFESFCGVGIGEKDLTSDHRYGTS